MSNCFKLACMALLLCNGLPALAADVDLSLKAPPIGWSGAYVGVDGGEIHTSSASSFANGFGGVSSGSSSSNKFLGGALAGYNWQIGRWVLGVEGDWSIVNNSSSFRPNLYTLRGRAGWTYENTLVYLTAGGATHNAYASIGFNNNGAFQVAQTSFAQRKGPVAGGGVEMKLPYHLSGRVEGLYYFTNGSYHFSPFTWNGFNYPAAVLNATAQHLIYRASLIYNFN